MLIGPEATDPMNFALKDRVPNVNGYPEPLKNLLIMKAETLEIRQAIIEAAIDLYINDHNHFTVKYIAEKAGLSPADIYSCFPNKEAILRGFYTQQVHRYRLMIEEIDGFEDFTLAEKLSNFIYASFDLMQEQREFVEETFESKVLNAYSKTEYHKEVENLLKDFFTGDDRISSSSRILIQSFFYDLLRKEYFNLVLFWLDDASPDYEKSMALTDKLTGFLEEVMYSAVFDKGVDLFKFAISNGALGYRLAAFKRIFSNLLN